MKTSGFVPNVLYSGLLLPAILIIANNTCNAQYASVTDDVEKRAIVEYREKIEADYVNVTIDNSNNIVVTGFFSDSVCLHNQTLYSKGTLDIFLAKFSSHGDLIWVKHAGGSNIDFSKFVGTDNNDNIYIQGLYKGKARIGDVELNSKGSYDMFTAKFNNHGELLWVKTNHEIRVRRSLKFNS